MTKEELSKLEPGTLVDVTVSGVFRGVFYYVCASDIAGFCEVTDEGGLNRWWFKHENISLHVPQPQVSGTIEITMKLKCLRCREEWSISVFARSDYPEDRLKSLPCPFCDSDETQLGAQ